MLPVVCFVSLTVAGEMFHVGFVRLGIRLSTSSGPVAKNKSDQFEQNIKNESEKGKRVQLRSKCMLGLIVHRLLFLLMFSCCCCKCYDIIGPGHFDYWMEFLGVMNP